MCALPDQTVIHEYYTFRFKSESNDYFLTKYSFVIEQKSIGDEYPVQTLTNKDFGEISLSKFDRSALYPFKNRFPDFIREVLPAKFPGPEQ